MSKENDYRLLLEFDIEDRYGEKFVSNNPFLGYKGEQFLQSGMIFAPYIPMVEAITIVEDQEEARQLWERFAPKKSITERYAQKTVNKKFYEEVRTLSKYYTGTTFTELI